MVRFSPGIAQGCHELLILLRRYQHPPEKILEAFPQIGIIASERIFDTAQSLDWVHLNEHGILAPTAMGERLLRTSDYWQLLRQMLLDYIDIERPSWLQNAVSGRARVLTFAGSEIGQVFVEAMLADGIDDETVAFWDTLSARARGQKDDRLNQIGRSGERLTMAYELQRTNHPPRWISIESNEDGYDILSVLDRENHHQLSIEVKATSIGIAGTFHITINEWERAQENLHHVFHLWDISKQPAKLCIVSVATMAKHIPDDNGKGSWESACVPFETFKEEFSMV